MIGTAGTAEKAALARKAGARHGILYRDEDFAARVKAITNGKMCRVVYDGVGRSTFLGSLDSLQPFGLLASYGSASGKVEGFDLGILAAKGSLFLTRPTLATYTADPGNLRKMARDLFKVVASGEVRIALSATAPLDHVVAVHRSLEARETTGSTVLTI